MVGFSWVTDRTVGLFAVGACVLALAVYFGGGFGHLGSDGIANALDTLEPKYDVSYEEHGTNGSHSYYVIGTARVRTGEIVHFCVVSHKDASSTPPRGLKSNCTGIGEEPVGCADALVYQDGSRDAKGTTQRVHDRRASLGFGIEHAVFDREPEANCGA